MLPLPLGRGGLGRVRRRLCTWERGDPPGWMLFFVEIPGICVDHQDWLPRSHVRAGGVCAHGSGSASRDRCRKTAEPCGKPASALAKSASPMCSPASSVLKALQAPGARCVPTSTYLHRVNVPFSHPSDLYPQKDGRKVRSCWKGTFTFVRAPGGRRRRRTTRPSARAPRLSM